MSELSVGEKSDYVRVGERVYRDGTGQVVSGVHRERDCRGRPCVVHRPSDHHMRGWPTHFRLDRGITERICPHGVGHPDPDDLAWRVSLGHLCDGVHGCDGCCAPPEAA